MAEPRPELSRPIPLGAIPPAGRTETVVATPAECRALAARFAIPAIEALEAGVTLLPAAAGAVRATGRLKARVVQDCVVTLDPFTQEVEAPLDLLFRPAGDALSDDPDGPDEMEYEGNAIELGEAVAEQLSLALDPYPRSPGATLPPLPEEPEAPEPARPSPFAALAGRRPKG